MPWTAAGAPPVGTRALAYDGGLLYAVDQAGRLRYARAQRGTLTWSAPLGTATNASITAMTGAHGILYAATSGGQLVRTNRDLISESSGWATIDTVAASTGLAIIEHMLFTVGPDNKLWQRDLTNLRT